jgi:hypothetical protein
VVWSCVDARSRGSVRASFGVDPATGIVILRDRPEPSSPLQMCAWLIKGKA